MPRVLRIINRLNLGGPTYNAAYLTKYLAPEFETMLIAGVKDESEESSEYILDKMGLEATHIHEMRRSINPFQDRIAYLKIKSIIKDFKPDIVHTHAAKAGTIGRLAAHACHVPVIVHTFHGHVFHSYFGPLKTKAFIKIERYLASRSSKIIAISDQQKSELSMIYWICPPAKIAVIPLGFDLDRFHENMDAKRADFRKKYLLDDDEVAIGIVGRIVPVKNHKLFVDALDIVLKRTSKKVRAFIIGDGEDRANIEQIASSLNIKFVDFTKEQRKAPLTFTSWIKDIDWAMAGMDLIALTSLNEGTPVSLIEAQAAGKPIVSTSVGGVENIVLPNVTAILGSPARLVNFANNLVWLVENEQIRKKMGDKGWEHVHEKFHYTRLVEDTRKLYHQLLNQ
jgi:glycosyltransferase involved in cell wall biosynthesis